ncbi:MAG TPA: DinB family protein [Planctomycetota bacterium]|nr:DinB family protein [Planctomycetota bacterium]
MLQHLADQLRRAFEGGAWHGPAVLELLAGVDAARAAAVPQPGRHSIWALSLHIAAWLDAARRRTLGEQVQLEGDADFPPVLDHSAAKWQAAREHVRSNYRALHDTIIALQEQDLQRQVPGKDYTVHFLLDGVIQHSLYHAGQITLLQKLVPADDRAFLRHCLATLAYRAAKATRDAPAAFAGLRIGPTSRTPVQILAHMGDLFDWALTMAQGRTAWHDSPPLPWPEEVERFFATLRTFDDWLAGDAPLLAPVPKLFQGPVADALTHTGQLTLLRRVAQAPVKGESYFKSDVQIGRVGKDQAVARVEFD